jgi:hypothetical protein
MPGEWNSHWGVPWSFTTQAGLENKDYTDETTGKHFDPLLGSSGPWPDIHLFNARGEHMAQEVRPIGYLHEGTMDSRLVFPDYLDMPIHDVEWMVLKQNPRDPICIVDLSIIHMSPLGKQRGGLAFSSVTAQQVYPCPSMPGRIKQTANCDHDILIPFAQDLRTPLGTFLLA